MSDTSNGSLHWLRCINGWGKALIVVLPLAIGGIWRAAALETKQTTMETTLTAQQQAIQKVAESTQQLAVSAAARDAKMDDVIRRLGEIVARLERR